MAEFSFAQVEAVLARLNDIADHKRVAFGGRLKFLQKNGIPVRRAKPGGRGKPGSFTFSEMMQLAAAIELLQAGLTPQKAARIISTNWTILEPTMIHAVRPGAISGPGKPEFWMLRLAELGELMEGHSPDYDLTYVVCMDAMDLPGVLSGEQITPVKRRRMMILKGAELVTELIKLACHDFKFATEDQVWESITDEIARERKRAHEVIRLFKAHRPKWQMPIDPDTNQEIDKKKLIVQNARAFWHMDSRLVPLDREMHAKRILQRISSPARHFILFISLCLWGKPGVTPAEFNEKGGMLFDAEELRWGGAIDDLYSELIKHEILTEPSSEAGPELSSIGVLATMELAKEYEIELRKGIVDTSPEGIEAGGSADVSTEA